MFRPPVVRPADAPVPSAPPLPPNYAAPAMSSALASPNRPSPESPVRYPDLSAETVPMVSLLHGAGASSFSQATSPTKADPVLDLPPSYAAGGAPPPAYSNNAGFPTASVPVGVATPPSSVPESPAAHSPPSSRSAFALRLFPVSLTIGAALSLWLVAINVTIFNVNTDASLRYNHDDGDLFNAGSERTFAGVFAALLFLSAMFDLTWLFSYRTSQMPRFRMRVFLVFTLVAVAQWWLVQSTMWEVAFFQLLGMSGGIDTATTFLSPSLFMVLCLVSRMMTLAMFRQAMGRRVAPN
ncbi:hypothetical protein AMAG_02929 [Allomyces macrogynus ATCC 38327]|uniref:Uncharacterized protein n=1 Tax=Allomyces macrogynus (strain ATCC 38327) TaxID=578462 RepID=A0A0L0S490_ALLM3|nr:hypothetical protein AMAG_02929 [Allomyces macrogynus ATCC 38327]|eukprot:KNE57184.1 hypothetical protein AMAG_02929 [Allomyces macrogynus ATCC 38327]